jgi:uncharacterized membrane protein
MKAKDLILIALICVNITLAAVAGTWYVAKSEPAALAGSESRAGDYLMVAGAISDSREVLLVIDVVAQRANLYVPAAGAVAAGTPWELKDVRNLATDFSGGR